VNRRLPKILGWVTVGLLVALLGGLIVVRLSIKDLNTDDQLINRGQQVNSCIGDRQDAIDQWRAIATFEFVHQVERLEDGLPIDTALAEKSERAIYDLVDAKQEIRAQQLALIEANDPAVQFECPAIPRGLMPPQLPD